MRLLSNRIAFGKLQVVFMGAVSLIQKRVRGQSLAPNAQILQFSGPQKRFITLAEPSYAASIWVAFPGVEIDIEAYDKDGGDVWVKSPYVFGICKVMRLTPIGRMVG